MANVKKCRNYEKELVEVLSKNGREIKAYNALITIKQVPDLNENGNLDPRVLTDLNANQGAFTGAPNEAIRYDVQGQENAAKLLKFLRMLSEQTRNDPEKNKCIDLTDGTVEATQEEFFSEGRMIKMWKFETGKGSERVCYIHFHGGGFFMGSPNGNDETLKYIAEKANAVVFDVDYSLVPEHTFPAGFNDCYNALDYIYTNADKYGISKEKIVIGGESGGGNLAAAVALRDRDENKNRIALQVLGVPAVMQTKDGHPSDFIWKTEDFDVSGTAKIIADSLVDTRISDGLNFMFYAYTAGKDVKNPYISPAMTNDFSCLPRTLIMTAEYDSLRQQGEYYGGKLQQAGVDTTIIRYNGLRHEDIGYLGFVPQAEDFTNIIIEELKKLNKEVL